MKVLVAAPPPGWRGPRNDCLDGELVWMPPRCGDPNCSCLSTFAGCVTHGLTPTARVERLDTTPAQLTEMLRATVCRDCWPPSSIPRLARTLIALAERFPVDAVVARGPRGGTYRLRPQRWPEGDD